MPKTFGTAVPVRAPDRPCSAPRRVAVGQVRRFKVTMRVDPGCPCSAGLKADISPIVLVRIAGTDHRIAARAARPRDVREQGSLPTGNSSPGRCRRRRCGYVIPRQGDKIGGPFDSRPVCTIGLSGSGSSSPLAAAPHRVLRRRIGSTITNLQTGDDCPLTWASSCSIGPRRFPMLDRRR